MEKSHPINAEVLIGLAIIAFAIFGVAGTGLLVVGVPIGLFGLVWVVRAMTQ